MKQRKMIHEWLRRFDAIESREPGYDWTVMTQVGLAHAALRSDGFHLKFPDIDRAIEGGIRRYDGTFCKPFNDTGWERFQEHLDKLARLF